MEALPVGTPPSRMALGERKHYLLLDGIKLEPLEQWLYQHLDAPLYEPIYLHTPLAECRQISPCLVALEPGSPVWEAFLERGILEGWGWLFTTEASLEEAAEHLRWLLFVEHPLEGERILRTASPEVMRCLFEAELQPHRSQLLGVMEELWLPTVENSVVTWWHVAQAHHDEPLTRTARFSLQQAHLDSLSRIAWQRFAQELAHHLDTYFATGPLIRECGTAAQAAKQVIDTTRELGFFGRRAHYYMANILGAHGHVALDEQRMPDLARPLSQADGRPPMERLKAVAAEARRLSSREIQA
ncbi:DUF4123 domain-containing protein [Billgrantia kenyensis]|uniref:DUF4123 domain-containing protein n=1 Tax=Billgrantia kenyensis TaxID=321266 RepID=A0A7V9VZ68_9GAMM|nr:DUF4123 domain-containing protein [Halomonas kenyensis]MBA2778002.1 DUF4123 domain-containing protein [Halomonas kenyensis]MCG6661473.1 DUF4123 domain-containing protein [Halomonas kenyensis]